MNKLIALALFAAASLPAAQIEVANDLEAARARETIEVKLNRAGPFVVRDAAGAEREFLLALRLDPSFPYSLEALSRLYAAAGRPDLAASFAELAARAGRGERLSRQEVERVVARFR